MSTQNTWWLVGITDWGGVAGQVPARRQPSDPYSPLFTQSFLSCFPCVLSPVVIVRLLLHRILTTAAHLQRWKSCASRSSFASASAHDAPRSPRSRASSTDTEPSSLRKRRKVSIWGSLHDTVRQSIWFKRCAQLPPGSLSGTCPVKLELGLNV